jgi:hypothetical protein
LSDAKVRSGAHNADSARKVAVFVVGQVYAQIAQLGAGMPIAVLAPSPRMRNGRRHVSADQAVSNDARLR